MKKRTKNTINNNAAFLLVIVVVIIIKFSAVLLPPFGVDMSAWIAWADRLARLGPGQFYSTEVWTQYTPGYLYWLWLGGKFNIANELWVKIPIVIVDLLAAYLVWIIGKKTKFSARVGSFYLLAPAVVFVGAVWGQIDGVLAFLMLLSIYLASEKKRLSLAFIVWAFAVVMKPQAFMIFPAMFLVVKNNYSAKETIKATLLGLVVALGISVPFFPGDPILGLPNLVIRMGEFYSYTSLYAYNIWIFISGAWKQDSTVVLGLPLYAWGVVFYLLSVLMILVKFWQAKKSHLHYLISFLSILAFYLFPTRVYEQRIGQRRNGGKWSGDS